MPTQTTNFNFDKPLVNDPIDEDIWGGQLNGNWDSIDGILPVPAASKFGALTVQSTDDATFEILSDQGTSGQILTSNGADALPSYQNFGTGWILLETIIASNDTSIDFTSSIDSNFRTYIFQITNLVFAQDSSNFRMLGSTNTGSSYLTATDSYKYHNTINSSSASGQSSVFSDNDGSTFINLLTSWGNVTNEGLSATIMLSNPSNSSIFKHVYGTVMGISGDSGDSQGGGIFSTIQTTSAVDAIRFLSGTGNITSGTFQLFGV